MTETGSSVVFEGDIIPGIDLRIVEGEIQVKGPVLLRAYRDGTDPRTDDGWYPTGDAGVLDDDGRLTVFGRRGDLIITGGENVWPGPVEDILATLPSVSEVAVIGRPDNDWVQAVTAVVVPADSANPPTLDELRAAVKERMLPAHAPRGVEYVDALPRTPLGKVRRSDL
jgi:O-succinylbenzoic acid--CoA ligase